MSENVNARHMSTTLPQMEKGTARQDSNLQILRALITEKKIYVEIIEQPCKNGYRFRYENEGRRAGTIKGVNSTPKHKTYPTIKVHGFNGPFVVVGSLVRIHPPHYPHPHQLVGADCKEGYYSKRINDSEMTCCFSDLRIQYVKRKDVKESLALREKREIDPFGTTFSHASELSKTDFFVVRLCFQVFLETEGGFIPLLPKLSEPIYDSKNASDLVIVNLVPSSADVDIRQEVILLCGHVNKDDIQIIFEETNDDGIIIWSTDVPFSPENIHYNAAISFETPEYINKNVERDVECSVYLRRPSDGSVGNRRAFTLLKNKDLVHKKEKFRESPILQILHQIKLPSENSGATADVPFNPCNKSNPVSSLPAYGNEGYVQTDLLVCNNIENYPFPASSSDAFVGGHSVGIPQNTRQHVHQAYIQENASPIETRNASMSGHSFDMPRNIHQQFYHVHAKNHATKTGNVSIGEHSGSMLRNIHQQNNNAYSHSFANHAEITKTGNIFVGEHSIDKSTNTLQQIRQLCTPNYKSAETTRNVTMGKNSLGISRNTFQQTYEYSHSYPSRTTTVDAPIDENYACMSLNTHQYVDHLYPQNRDSATKTGDVSMGEYLSGMSPNSQQNRSYICHQNHVSATTGNMFMNELSQSLTKIIHQQSDNASNFSNINLNNDVSFRDFHENGKFSMIRNEVVSYLNYASQDMSCNAIDSTEMSEHFSGMFPNNYQNGSNVYHQSNASTTTGNVSMDEHSDSMSTNIHQQIDPAYPSNFSNIQINKDLSFRDSHENDKISMVRNEVASHLNYAEQNMRCDSIDFTDRSEHLTAMSPNSHQNGSNAYHESYVSTTTCNVSMDEYLKSISKIFHQQIDPGYPGNFSNIPLNNGGAFRDSHENGKLNMVRNEVASHLNDTSQNMSCDSLDSTDRSEHLTAMSPNNHQNRSNVYHESHVSKTTCNVSMDEYSKSMSKNIHQQIDPGYPGNFSNIPLNNGRTFRKSHENDKLNMESNEAASRLNDSSENMSCNSIDSSEIIAGLICLSDIINGETDCVLIPNVSTENMSSNSKGSIEVNNDCNFLSDIINGKIADESMPAQDDIRLSQNIDTGDLLDSSIDALSSLCLVDSKSQNLGETTSEVTESSFSAAIGISISVSS